MHTAIIFCAQYLIFLIALAAFVYWLTLPKKAKVEMAVYGLITAIVAFTLAKIGSSVFYDSRPFVTDHVTPFFAHGNDNGFPSDHTLLSCVAAVTIFSASKKWGLSLLALALIVGAARVLAHVHRPIDILGSLVFAVLGGLVAWYAAPKITARILNSRQNTSDTSAR